MTDTLTTETDTEEEQTIAEQIAEAVADMPYGGLWCINDVYVTRISEDLYEIEDVLYTHDAAYAVVCRG